MRTVALALFLVTGCYEHHEVAPRDGGRDAGLDARVDAGFDTGFDAGPDAPPPRGTWWRLEPRAAWLSVPNELGCSVVEGGTAVVRSTVGIENTCERPGPAFIRAEEDGLYTVQAFVWVRHPVTEDVGCFGTTDIGERNLTIRDAEAGEWVVDDIGGGGSVIVSVLRERPSCRGSGSVGDPCRQDCECGPGLGCIPALGDFIECFGGRCGRVCESTGDFYDPDLDCQTGEVCSARDGLAAPLCRRRTEDGCSFDCEPGLQCLEGGDDFTGCDWGMTLNGDNRHPCAVDAECDAGLVCVEHDEGRRNCEVPCFTDGQRCPPMHFCAASTWVCEWLGE